MKHSKNISMAKWLEIRKRRVRITSQKTYKSYEQVHILPFLGETLLEAINKKMLCKLKKHLKKKYLAPKTIHDILIYVNKILKDAKAIGYIKVQPEAVKNKAPSKEKEILTAGEQKKLCSNLKNRLNPKDMAVILACATGLRLGEVVGLNVGNVDLEAGVLRVSQSRQRVTVDKNKKTCVVLSDLKSKKSRRDIPLNTSLKVMLQNYISTIDGEDASTPLICNQNKKALDSRTIQNHFSHLKKIYHLSGGVTFHSLRHSFATRALENGVDMQVLSELLGHANVAFTLNCYGHCVTEHKRQQMAKMENCW